MLKHTPSAGALPEYRRVLEPPATFLLLGEVCARLPLLRDRQGKPGALDEQGPTGSPTRWHTAKHAVLTAVNRDGQPTAGRISSPPRSARSASSCPTTGRGADPRLRRQLGRARRVDARPDVLNHNIETVPRIFRRFRRAGYRQSLELLARAALGGPA
jgi:lipoic acid synthetase